MLKHTDSVDSTYRLRKNPLNIRNQDGSDFILSKVDKLGQMAENRQRAQAQQVYPGPRPTSTYQLRDDVYDDSDSGDSISDETSFSITPSPRHSKIVQEQLQNIRQRPMSYPNINSAALELEQPPKKRTHSRGTGSHESLSAILSKEIHEDREELTKDGGVDLLALSIPTGKPTQHKPHIDLGPTKIIIPPPPKPVITKPVATKPVAAKQPVAKKQAATKPVAEKPQPKAAPPAEIPVRSVINFDAGATPPVPRKNSFRNSFQLDLPIGSPNLSSFMSEFSSLSFNQPLAPSTQLGRKNTITSPNVKVSASKAGAGVFERMRSLRKSQSKETMRSRLEKKPSTHKTAAPIAIVQKPSVQASAPAPAPIVAPMAAPAPVKVAAPVPAKAPTPPPTKAAAAPAPEFKKPELKKPSPKPIPAKAEIIEIPSTPELAQKEPLPPADYDYAKYKSLDPEAPRLYAIEQKRLQAEKAKADEAARIAAKAKAEADAEAEAKRIAEDEARRAKEQEAQLAAAIEQSRLEQERIEQEQEARLMQGPASPVVSLNSYDSHMVNQLCAIPSPIMNAISFTPPLGATVEEDEEEMSEIESIFSGEEENKDKTEASGEEAEVEEESDNEPTVGEYNAHNTFFSFYY